MSVLQQKTHLLKKYLKKVEKVRQVLSNLLKSTLIDNMMRDLADEIIHNMITMQLTLRSADSEKTEIEIIIQMIQTVTEVKLKLTLENENYE